MPDLPMTLGPVGQLLTEKLKEKVRRTGIAVWLDNDGVYSDFVNRLAEQYKEGTFPYPVIAFRGSFLETMFALEVHGSGYERSSLIIYMPGFDEKSIRSTPLLELYEAGSLFRKGLDTLVREAATGRALPADVDAFLKGQVSLVAAEEWLARGISKRTVGLEALLESSGSTLVVEALSKRENPLAVRVTTEEDAGALRSYLHKLTGMDDAWMAKHWRDRGDGPLDKTLAAFGAWVLCVEFVHDLRRNPNLDWLIPLKSLSTPLVTMCRGIAAKLRKQDPDAYVRIADETESHLDDELLAMTPEDLGQVDTFREEENRVLWGAVESLKAKDWAKAAEWCKAREGDKSFWLQRDPARRRAWDLVAGAAEFGKILDEHVRPFEKVANHDDVIKAYGDSAFLVDRAHRRFEQEWLRRLDTQMPHFGALQEVLGKLRELHRVWADQISMDFNRLCKAEGFLPPEHLQQRTLYEQVVQPMAFGGEKVAVFLIDAFRYEMATELLDGFRSSAGGALVDLKGRYAELPTITSVGMNALAPVAKDGRLSVAKKFEGFKTGECTVKSPSDRARAMGTRTCGKAALCITLAEICDLSAETLKKKIKEHQVVVVCSSELDNAGEANVGLLTFDAQLTQLKAAWHHLQTAGIKHAVFTADHGFLLQDSTTGRRDYGRKTDPQRRYVLDDYERGERGLVPVSVAQLGYDGISGYLLFPEDSKVFTTGNTTASFVHGGNSPQERIIPVLVVTRKRAETSSLAEYIVEAEPMTEAFGFNRIRVRLVLDQKKQTTLGFVAARSIDLDLRVPDRPEIRAVVKEKSGPGEIKAGRLQLPVGKDWTEVFFALNGPEDSRAQVEVLHTDQIEKVQKQVVDGLFAVAGMPGGVAQSASPSKSVTWVDTIEDEGARKVLTHIEKHGSITEIEMINLLGNPRAARRFAREIDGYLPKLPFRIRSEANASGKRYVRE